MADVRHVVNEEYYEVTVRLTPEEYRQISQNAAWGSSNGSISTYLVECALGKTRRGC